MAELGEYMKIETGSAAAFAEGFSMYLRKAMRDNH